MASTRTAKHLSVTPEFTLGNTHTYNVVTFLSPTSTTLFCLSKGPPH